MPQVRRIITDPDTIRESIHRNVQQAISAKFPIETAALRAELKGLQIKHEPLSHNRQKKIILAKGNASDGVLADIDIIDKSSGKVLLSLKKHRLMNLPYFTNRYTFLLGGNEYAIVNQLRTKSGVYTRKRGNDKLESSFNLEKGANFKLVMDPESGKFKVDILHSTIPLFALLKILGADTNRVRQVLGEDLFKVNSSVSESVMNRAVDTLYTKLVRYKTELGDTAGKAEKIAKIKAYFAGTKLNEETTRLTLGAAHSRVDVSALISAAQKILRIYNEEDDVDERDNLEFQQVYSVEDIVKEVLDKSTAEVAKIKARLQAFRPTGNTRDDQAKIKSIFSPVYFTRPLRSFITTSSIARMPTQINAMEMLDTASIVTRLGEGAISSESAVPESTRAVNYSYMGTIDPIAAPESSKIGIDNRFSIAAMKGDDNEIYREVRNLKSGKIEKLRVIDLYDKYVGLPDEVYNKGRGKSGDIVPAVYKGKLVKVKRSQLDYQTDTPHELNTVTTNSLPFANSNQGNRLVMGSKHLTQALPLKYRDTRLVEAAMPSLGLNSTMDIVGGFLEPKSPVDGVVAKIDEDYIYVKDADGAVHRVDYQNNTPLATKTMLHNELTVKPGDEVKKGQSLGTSNFTKDGKLAQGKNLKVAYMPYHGMNHEDGIVVSESAAKKLTSVHADRVTVTLDKTRIADRDKFASQFPTRFTAAQLKNIDGNGIVKKGSMLHDGDPIILVLADNANSRMNQVLGSLHKSLISPYRDESEVYEGAYPAHVVETLRSGNTISVLLKIEKPASLGDKLCYDQHTEVLTDSGWVRIPEVTWEDKICTLNPSGEIEYQEFTETHMYPRGDRMYRLATQQLDMLVTDKHRNFVKDSRAQSYSLVPADEMYGKRVRFKKSGVWVGESPRAITLPALEVKAGQSGNGTRWMPEMELPVETYMMLLGAYLSEGNLVFHGGSGTYGIDIACPAEHKRNALLPALDKAGVKYTLMQDGGDPRSIRIYSKQLYTEFSKYGAYAHCKQIPNHIFTYAKEDLQVLFDWLMWGDGHRNRKSGLPVCYTTVSKRLADDIQRLCLHIGIAANVAQMNTARVDTIAGTEYRCRPTWRVGIVSMKLEPQINHGHVNQQNAQVEQWVENFKEPVFCITVPNHVMYVRRNGKAYWSGNSGSYGNKGVISYIEKDENMPRDESGEPLDAVFTSAGVISRINPAQILESALGKVALKTGKPYQVENFGFSDNVAFVQQELKKHGVKDKETLTEPATGKKIHGIFTGVQHVHKLFKTTDTNYAARGIEGPHDQDDAPVGSGQIGPKALGGMEVNALIAHNARNILREGASLRNFKNMDFWSAFQYGGMPRMPTEKKAFNKFVSILNQAGVKVERKGDDLVAGPLTDKDVLSMSSGQIKDAKRLNAKLEPETGGLFDINATGGLKGTKWSHVKLAEPVVNPLFEDCIMALLGLNSRQLGEVFARDGGKALRDRLNRIDVNTSLLMAEKQMDDPRVKGDALDKLVKKVKYLRALKEKNLKPGDAYMLENIPVTPPVMRPITIGKTGDKLENDANLLYRNLILENGTFEKIKGEPGMEKETVESRKALQDSVRELVGTIAPQSPHLKNAGVKGAIQFIAGDQPKRGYFQRKVVYSKMNLSGRATISPDNTLGLDEVGLPEDMAWSMYKPFIIRQLTQMGYGAMQAKKAVEDRSDMARKILEAELDKRPVLINRAPTLWKHSIFAVKPRLRSGKNLLVNTLWEKSTAADFDGDAMAIHVPVSDDAVKDAHKMMPSKLIFSDKKRGDLLAAPSIEPIAGLYKATVNLGQPHSGMLHKFPDELTAWKAYHSGRLKATDPVEIG